MARSPCCNAKSSAFVPAQFRKNPIHVPFSQCFDAWQATSCKVCPSNPTKDPRKPSGNTVTGAPSQTRAAC
jgi:hypothetical protein